MNLEKRKKRGYTMIEILVVISIIGFILSAAMYLLTSSRENARIARAKEFASIVNGKLGSSMIGWWALDEGSGNNANDGWAKNNGCAVGSNFSWVDGMFGKALSFTGNTYFRLPCGSGSLSPAITSSDITITAWFKASPGSAGGTIVAIGNGKAFGLGIGGVDRGKVVAPYNNSNNAPAKSSKDYRDDKWHFVAVKMGSSGVSPVQIWIDGALDGSSSTSVSGFSTYANLGTGQGLAWGYFIGTVDDVKLYNESLTAQEIQKYYAEGADKYQVAVK